jgi:homoserine O-acetyltransferase
MMLESAVRLQQEAPTRQASSDLYGKFAETARKEWDANDFLYWVESSFDYDPQPDLGKIKAKVVAVNFADDAINPAELPDTGKLVRSIPGATFVLVPASDETLGHLSLRLAALWKGYLAEALAASAHPTAKAGR